MASKFSRPSLPPLQGQAALIHDRMQVGGTHSGKEVGPRVTFGSPPGANALDELLKDLDSLDPVVPTYLPALPPPPPVNAALRRRSGGGKSPPSNLIMNGVRRENYRDIGFGLVLINSFFQLFHLP